MASFMLAAPAASPSARAQTAASKSTRRRPAAGSHARPAPAPRRAPGRARCSSPPRTIRWWPFACSSTSARSTIPPVEEGLAALTSDVVGQGGTAKRTYAEVLDALYPLAARIRVIGDVESIVFEGTVHRDNLAAFAELLAEQVLQPRFAADDFARHRQNAIDYLTKTLRGNDDEDLGKQALASVMYAGHQYRRPATGDRRRPGGHQPGRRQAVLRHPLFPRSSHRRRRRRIPRRLRRDVRGAVQRASRQGRAAAAAEGPARPQGGRGADRREGDARQRHLHRLSHLAHPGGPRFLSADRGAVVPGRTPDVQRRPDEPPARRPRAELRGLRLYRKLHPGRMVDLSPSERAAPPAALRDLAASGAAAERAVRAARRRPLHPQAAARGDPGGRIRVDAHAF